MGLTLNNVCQAVSDELFESSLDSSSGRIRKINRGVLRATLDGRWKWRRTKDTITTVVDKAAYSLPSSFDYPGGMYEVWDGNTQIFPDDYDNLNSKDWAGIKNLEYYAISPYKEEIILYPTPSSVEDITLIHYAIPPKITSTSSEWSPSIPRKFLRLVVLATKYLIHRGKRQRNDARNTILEYKEVLKEMRTRNAGKSKGNQNRIEKAFSFLGFNRSYEK